jgi:thioester reductase-like protein
LHVGANVNLVEPYSRVRPSNVVGTREVLRLVVHRRIKAVHFVSTASTVVGGPGDPDPLPPHWRTDPQRLGGNGYLRSKWVAEETVRLAQQLGVPTAVYRPSRISGDSVTGAMTEQDAFWHYLRACIEVGACPAGPGFTGLRANLVPVDHVAAALVAIASRTVPDGTAFNLVNHADTTLSSALDVARAGHGHRRLSLCATTEPGIRRQQHRPRRYPIPVRARRMAPYLVVMVSAWPPARSLGDPQRRR